MECGGKRSATPLSSRLAELNQQNPSPLRSVVHSHCVFCILRFIILLHHTRMNNRSPISRRQFLQNTAKTVAAGALLPALLPSTGKAAASSQMIGIQVGAISFVDEGTEKVLDI